MKENIDLFMEALYEAIVLVVLIALVGFWEWRSALLMALSMPITLAMTFGMSHAVGIDLQQVSIATLIIALGLLVDDPGRRQRRHQARARRRSCRAFIAAWLGPTKLARAILYATVTNIVAYLPFLMLTGSTGDFLHSLPIVMTARWSSSRLVSMTFIPLLGYYLLRPAQEAGADHRGAAQRGLLRLLLPHCRTARSIIAGSCSRGSLVFLVVGGLVATRLKSQFFPEDVQYWSYVDVWLPNDAPLSATNDTAAQAEQVIRRVTANSSKQHPDKDGSRSQVLKSVTTFVGGGGPRFWFSVSPEQQQHNYAQVLIQSERQGRHAELVEPLQRAVRRDSRARF